MVRLSVSQQQALTKITEMATDLEGTSKLEEAINLVESLSVDDRKILSQLPAINR
ncbi:hypothetical protein [Dactylococcopsis salina]|uniref:Uncharacterized protein n=1 Tax=Dactylococcopsis salina (strain PCC 8305) TaxID=13035 RepID=K9YWL7_DACS8|nr:hypothetical protein [Dactylococcopsis salina]AFZ50518.1 hypothetical protein Dacsa_1863 [Dactylococcopsis salina PCC 8305]